MQLIPQASLRRRLPRRQRSRDTGKSGAAFDMGLVAPSAAGRVRTVMRRWEGGQDWWARDGGYGG